jgi:CDP-diacylglycerol--glycerol-3-phosphate 3-phosphatidyltransferase
MRRFAFLPQRLPKQVADPLGRAAGRIGLTPNMVSFAGLLGNGAAAWLITRDEVLAAGIVFLFFSALDMVDGALARATGQASPFGAVFDAVLDRLGEALVLAAAAWYFGDRGEYIQAGAAYAALFGSVMVSYMRARAEVMGFEMREGLFRRQERVVLLGAGLLLGRLEVAIWALALLSNATALQRFYLVARGLRGGEGQPAGGSS